MRSRTAIRWGEVKSPILEGMSCDFRYWERIESAYAHVEPLPLVPATWIILRFLKSDCCATSATLRGDR